MQLARRKVPEEQPPRVKQLVVDREPHVVVDELGRALIARAPVAEVVPVADQLHECMLVVRRATLMALKRTGEILKVR